MTKLFFLIAFFAFASAAILNESTQTFTKKVTPLSCLLSEKAFTVWRELEVKETVLVDSQGRKTSKFVSTITVHVRNDAGVELSDVEFREFIPDSVARTPDELFAFSLKPESVKKGSVMVTWLFDHFGVGEEKNASYAVNASVDPKALDDYAPPQIVLKQPMQGGGDLLLSVVVVLLFALAAYVGWKSFTGSV